MIQNQLSEFGEIILKQMCDFYQFSRRNINTGTYLITLFYFGWVIERRQKDEQEIKCGDQNRLFLNF